MTLRSDAIFPQIKPRTRKSEYPPLMVDAWTALAIYEGRCTEIRQIRTNDRLANRAGHVAWIREPMVNLEMWGYEMLPVASPQGQEVLRNGLVKDGVVMVDPLDIEITPPQFVPATAARGAVRIKSVVSEPIQHTKADDIIRCGHVRAGKTDAALTGEFRYRWDARHRKDGQMWVNNPVVWVLRIELVEMPELKDVIDDVAGVRKVSAW